jgi:hypothetical protein
MSMLSVRTVMRSVVPTASMMLPVLVRPAPAVICPAPVNWVKLSPVVPRVMGPSVVRMNPLSAAAVPSSTNVNSPG